MRSPGTDSTGKKRSGGNQTHHGSVPLLFVNRLAVNILVALNMITAWMYIYKQGGTHIHQFDEVTETNSPLLGQTFEANMLRFVEKPGKGESLLSRGKLFTDGPFSIDRLNNQRLDMLLTQGEGSSLYARVIIHQ